MDIACCSNYSLREARRLVSLGRYPEQGMYGTLGLERAGHTCTYLEATGSGWATSVTAHSRGRIGDVSLQQQVLATRSDFAFAASEAPLAGLAAMPFRRRGQRLAAVFHNPPDRQQLRSARGYDVAFALSHVAFEALVDLRGKAARTELLTWGPQLDFADYVARGATRVVSAGKSGRDIDLLAQALVDAQVPGLVYCSPSWTSPAGDYVTPRPFTAVEEYPTILSDMAMASVVAIPLVRTDRMLGLSEVNDALALGKPIVVTRSKHLDVDVEGIGCGISVDVGDRQGWTEALRRLHREPELAAAMGRRGRAWAVENWNSRLCDSQVAAALSA